MEIVINEWVFDGEHETTKAIMKFMSQTDFKGKEVLDIGCGSGILTVYASELGAKHIVAVDSDSRAVENTKQNCERNGITNAEVYWTDFMETDLKGDILIANLPRENAHFCMPKIKESLNEGGTVITSWLKTLPSIEEWFEITDKAEGIVYDTYVLRIKKE